MVPDEAAQRMAEKAGSPDLPVGQRRYRMADFPAFMKNPANRIDPSAQHTPGIEGYVYDGIDGSQMGFWTCHETAKASEHVHDYDEYMVVLEGCYTLLIEGQRIELEPGQEYLIPKGILHGGEVVAGTRTIHAFGGTRVIRAQQGRSS
jgi:quercetin dioxygenase-like cupin family protein